MICSLYLFLISALLSFFCCWRLISFAASRFIISGGGTSRSGPGGVPLLGGLGLITGVLGAYLVLAFLPDSCRAGAPFANPWMSLCCGTGVVFTAIGLWDDLKGLTPLSRLGGEFLVAAVFLQSLLGPQADFLSAILAALFPVFLILTGANFLNLCDNTDALAAGVTIISSLALFAVISHAGFVVPGFFTSVEHYTPLILAGASIGFLLWNRPPARLYLGDAGSLGAGALLAISFYSLSRAVSEPGQICALFLIAGYVLFDPLYVIIKRLSRKKPPWYGGTDHPSHDLRRVYRSLNRTLTVILSVHLFSAVTGIAVLTGLLPPFVALTALIPWIALLISARKGARLS